MRILVACEFSGRVREALTKKGHDVWSCDLLDTLIPSPKHYKGDVRDILYDGWDMMIAHPPCTYLAVSGARWFKDRPQEQIDALAFVQLLLDAPIYRIALENPVSVISTKIKKPTQIVHPYWFGHAETKATCLWLKNLTPLQPTHLIDKTLCKPVCHYMSPSKDRGMLRGITVQGFADAIASQWG